MPYTVKNFCFFHCPKTGGTSIAKALSQHGLGYKRKGHQHDPPGITRLKRNVVTVTYIREPVSWYKSWWAFIRPGSDGPSTVWWYKHNKDLHDLVRAASDFDQFVQSLPVGRLYSVYDIYTKGVDVVVTMDKMASHFKLLTGITLGWSNRSPSNFEISHDTFELIQRKERMTYERWFSGG